jgi:BolA protein
MSGGENGNRAVEQTIQKKLKDALNPVHLDIYNESYMHNVPPGSETHFKVVVVSDKFYNMSLIQVFRYS